MFFNHPRHNHKTVKFIAILACWHCSLEYVGVWHIRGKFVELVICGGYPTHAPVHTPVFHHPPPACLCHIFKQINVFIPACLSFLVLGAGFTLFNLLCSTSACLALVLVSPIRFGVWSCVLVFLVPLRFKPGCRPFKADLPRWRTFPPPTWCAFLCAVAVLTCFCR